MKSLNASPLLTRRGLLALGAAGLAAPRTGFAATAREITWEDLIPAGVPYAEIVGEGEMDEAKDTWRPIFDANATRLNTSLVGELIRLPGYIIPLELGAGGVTSFVLVPYVGACIHVPPPPPNQLVFVTTETPWPNDDLWNAIWVTGRLTANIQSLDIAEVGYEIVADRIEPYIW
jgi:hypothetical protein